MQKVNHVVVGIDSGSTSTKTVVLDASHNLLGDFIMKTGAKSRKAIEFCYEQALKKAGIIQGAVSYVISTGYGRKNVSFAHKDLTEITCHAKGIYHINPNIEFIIDVGGQDRKAIKIDKNGRVLDFVMNDKCSAGTGRFLEVMARVLEIDINKFGIISINAKKTVKISNYCTVFAESEVISRIAEEKSVSEIIKGIHLSMASKVISLAEKIDIDNNIAITGGVARNIGFIKEIEEILNKKVFIPVKPQFTGALGAALFALKEAGV